MPKTVRMISCCYCGAATMIDLAKVGRGVLTCDACGARLCSARMEAVVNKPIPVKRAAPERIAPLAPRWHGFAGSFASPAGCKKSKPKKKTKSKPKKRKSFLDRLEDIWDEIEDIID